LLLFFRLAISISFANHDGTCRHDRSPAEAKGAGGEGKEADLITTYWRQIRFIKLVALRSVFTS
jgi:hypothetical protein